MVQFKNKLSLNKTKYPYQDNITHGSCLCKNSYKLLNLIILLHKAKSCNDENILEISKEKRSKN
jgi:hypothetical protein